MIERDFTSVLGGVTRDPLTGDVIGAKASQLVLIGKMNTTAAMAEGIKIDNALGEWVNKNWSFSLVIFTGHFHWSFSLVFIFNSVTRLGDLLDIGQLFKAFGNN